MSEKTFIEQADDILRLPVLSDDNKKLLRNIQRSMIVEYSKYVRLASELEQSYEVLRVDEYVRIKAKTRKDGKRFTDDEANRLAKKVAEEKYGNYRIHSATARSMYAIIQHIDNRIADKNMETKYGTEYTPS